MWQHLFLPKLKAARKGFFRAVFLRNFGPDRLKCRVRAHVGAKRIKNYEGSCDRIERVFQKAELSADLAIDGAGEPKGFMLLQLGGNIVPRDLSRTAVRLYPTIGLAY